MGAAFRFDDVVECRRLAHSPLHPSEHFLNRLGGTIVGVVQQMRVDAQGDLRARMTKPAHGDDIDVGVDQARCVVCRKVCKPICRPAAAVARSHSFVITLGFKGAPSADVNTRSAGARRPRPRPSHCS